MSNKWYSVEEAMQMLDLSRHQIYRRIQTGRLHAQLDRDGKMRYRIAADSLANYADGAPDQGDGEMLRIPDAAAVLGFTPETVRRLCKLGELKYVRGHGARGHYRISRAAIEDYISSRAATPGEQAS